jgi:hypothetical protein
MLLFLDFDGVLHPVRSNGLGFFCRLELLETTLARYPDVQIIISSSWREAYPGGVLSDMLGRLGSRFIGLTPVLGESRYSEILKVMEAHPNIPYVILDDDPSLFPTDCQELLLCDPLIGFDERAVEELERRIQSARRFE